MNSYHLRVELHNSVLADYTKLHLAMGNAGFGTIVVADDGKKYQLPSAEYVAKGNFSLADLVSAAKKAANTTGRTSSIFAVQYTAWRSDSLTQVK